jgi:dihydropteroate synthase
MADVVREYKAAIVLMHMQGTPRMMQDDPRYDDVIQEICDFLKQRADYARAHGIPGESITIDPGIGFGKRVQDNYEILERIAEFASLGFPLLVGASRKSFIGKTLNREVGERIEGSLAACAVAISGGVDIVRIHDVGETKRFVKMYESIRLERG